MLKFVFGEPYTPPQPPGQALYRVRNDLEVSDTKLILNGVKYVRPPYRGQPNYPTGMPCVYTMEPTYKIYLTRAMQELSFAVFQRGTPSMSVARQKNRWRAYLGGGLAFANGTGFDMVDNEGNPDPRQDWINMQDTGADVELPAYDKLRLCGEPVDNPQVYITGIEKDGVLIVNCIDPDHLPTVDEVFEQRCYIRATTPGSAANDFPQGDGEQVLLPIFAYPDRPVTYPLEWLEKVEETTPPPDLPGAVELPDCLVIGPEYNGRVARLSHDNPPRTLNMPLSLTNEMSVTRPLRSDGAKVDPSSKVSFKFNSVWEAELYRLNTQWLGDWLKQPGIGWFDTGYPVFNLINCGGNLVIGVEQPFEFPGYLEIQVQDFYHPTYPTYASNPAAVFKQTLVTALNGETTYIKSDPKRGDVYLPNVAPERVFISQYKRDQNEQGLQFFPNLPCQTELNGTPVIVTAWGFHGSDTYVQVNGLWYLGEEMQPTEDQEGRVTHCKALESMPVPPPVAGWSRVE